MPRRTTQPHGRPGVIEVLAGLRRVAVCVVMAVGAPGFAQPTAQYNPGGVEHCLSCHDFGPESPVHNVLAGSHGISGEAVDMAGRRGCEDCHGPSAAHAQAPTGTAPAVSFGPRWTATSAAQDGPCLACHENSTAKHWRDALHMLNNLTCVTCHDIHAEQDKVLFEKQQAQVCTVCHKAQKQGIHGMERRAARNPPCTECHNPHDHESAQATMRNNQSAGCSHCHDLLRMADSARVSDKAKSYHKVMARPGSTCLQCHQGVAHAPAESAPAMQPIPQREKTVTLFYPGMADSDWLTQSHPGSQPLRQGASCQQCHRGEEAALGASRSAGFEPASRDIQVGFTHSGDELHVDLQWIGSEDDVAVSLMWGSADNEAFRRGGCFAACHSDLPGMSRDRGQQTEKYLWASRSQQQSIGKPSITRDAAALATLIEQGVFAETWQIQMNSTIVKKALVLADMHWQPAKLIWINKNYAEGRWQVALRAKMNNTGKGISFVTASKYTFGIALHSADNPGGKHWVSLPMSLSFGGDDTDFTAE